MIKQNDKNKILSGSPRIKKVSLWGRASAFVGQHIQQFFDSFAELWKTPFSTLMTILVLGLALSLPSIFQVGYKNVAPLNSQLAGASEINLFLKKGISEQRVKVLINKLGLYDDIETITYISRHQALQEFKQMSGFSKALNYLDENPLPGVLVVIPKGRIKSTANNKLLVAKLQREADVDLVRVDSDLIAKIQAILSLVVDLVFALALLLLLVVLLIVSNTIRLNILNERPTIEVLKLVGATNSFIQRPFLYIGALYGLLGGVIALLLTFMMVQWLQSGVMNLVGLYHVNFQILMLNLEEIMILIGLSTFLGFIASYISVKQYLVKIEPK